MFTYPQASELKLIEQKLVPKLTAEDPLFDIMPIVEVDNHVLSWEQKDDYTGLQQVRGLDGQPGRVNAVGGKRYTMQPGVYGEFTDIDETELTTKRQFGTFNQPINLDTEVREKQDQLLVRRLDRIRQIGWTLLSSGTFSVSQGTKVMHTDTYPLQTHSGSDWSTGATATPLADFRAAGLLREGFSTAFGTGAKAYMNQRTVNFMLANTNVNDIAGRRTSGLNAVLTIEEINKILLNEGLPQIVVYHEGYYTDAGSWTLHLPTDKVVIVGTRPGNAPVADYALTRNATNPNMEPGAYTQVKDIKGPPRKVEVHDGHNGGPRIYYPSSVIVMSV